VTRHASTSAHDVTGGGRLFGWRWIGESPVQFQCYRASGSRRQCSGNAITRIGHFRDINGNRCDLILRWAVNYRGQAFASKKKNGHCPP
jgi:hypothetical protein